MSIGDMIQAEVDAQDAVRYRFLLERPDTARHWFLLLSEGKGTPQQFSKMVDRVLASEQAAFERGRAASCASGGPDGN